MEEKTSLDEIVDRESKLSEIADFWLNVLEGLGGIPIESEYVSDGDRYVNLGSHPADHGSINDLNGFSVQYNLNYSRATLRISYQKQEVLTLSFLCNHQQYRTTYGSFTVSKYDKSGVWEGKLDKMLPRRELIIKEQLDRRHQRERDATDKLAEATKEKELKERTLALGAYLK